jgi:D-alanyl-lipoteichoic acid acyltransferase DltB (MBOAT superfamily)
MLFNSPEFILGFLPAAVAGYFLAGRLGGTPIALAWLFAASALFYAWFDPALLPLLLGSIGVNWVLADRIACCKRRGHSWAGRAWLWCGVIGNLGVLGWFKYAGFFAHNMGLLTGAEIPLGHPPLPLGISFFTFQQIMFLVQRSRRDAGRVGMLSYSTFVSFFPHLVAGPLVQPAEIIPQLSNPQNNRPDGEHIVSGLTVFLLGLAKKLVLADTFAAFADPGFTAAEQGLPLTLVEAWCATLSFSLQIYFDFSGYSDMAIGLARLFNINFPLNFDSPYQARNISEFWRRWHISLGSFLRAHVYIPLGGSRSGEFVRAGNLLVTMLIGGLWHGAAWTFVLWGGMHGMYLVAHKAFHRLAPAVPATLRCVSDRAAQALTLLAVVIAWVPFRADGVEAMFRVWRGMVGLDGIALPRSLIALVPALGRIADPVLVLRHLGDARTLSVPEAVACLAIGWFIVLALPNAHRLGRVGRQGALGASFAFTVQALFFAPSVQPFLYYQF